MLSRLVLVLRVCRCEKSDDKRAMYQNERNSAERVEEWCDDGLKAASSR